MADLFTLLAGRSSATMGGISRPGCSAWIFGNGTNGQQTGDAAGSVPARESRGWHFDSERLKISYRQPVFNRMVR
jgi:hypothetical protein